MTRIDGLTGFWYVLSQVHMVGVIDANSKKKKIAGLMYQTV